MLGCGSPPNINVADCFAVDVLAIEVPSIDGWCAERTKIGDGPVIFPVGRKG